jgi:hypothetical protein
MFDSPFDLCEVCKQYVLLDQTKRECAYEHDCHVAVCPFERVFAADHELRSEQERKKNKQN